MRKWNRLFLVASAAALASLSSIIVGCGGGMDTDTNTPFQGSYAGDWTVNRAVSVVDPADGILVTLEPNFSGILSLTVDIKGRIVGNLVTVGGQNYAVTGDVDEHGRLKGSLKTTDGDSFSFSGLLAEQSVAPGGTDVIADQALLNRTNTGGGTPTFRQGLGGEFSVSINGVKLSGSLIVQGGQSGT